MESDEDLARRLQQEFDEEARAADDRERRDALLAQKLAAGSHNLSDSEEEEEEDKRRKATKRQLTFTAPRQEEERRKEKSQTFTSPQNEEEECKEEEEEGRRGKEVNSEHMLSEEEEEEEEEEKEEQEEKEGEARGRKAETSQAASPPQRQPHRQPQTDTDTDAHRSRPVCKYGAACYRKNPDHLREFAHPHQDGGGGGGGGGIRGGSATKRNDGEKKEAEKRRGDKREGETREGEKGEQHQNKRQRSDHEGMVKSRDPFPVRLSNSAPFRLFLNKCFSVKATQTDPLTLVLPDLLHPDHGTLLESAQLNFMVDLDFLMTHYKSAKVNHKPLLVAYGQLEGNASDYPALTCVKVQLPFQYGTHHTKAMLLLYPEGLRVVVHTANLVPDDWYEKTQGYWLSPLCPPLENGKSGVLEGESPTRFKRDLVEYLQAYKVPELTRWATTVMRHDFTECNAILVGSVPGYHMGSQRDAWGHAKVRRVLAQHSAPPGTSRGQHHTTVVQCSSIGSLGKDHRSWLSTELGLSLAGHKTTSTVLPAALPKVCVVYPSQEDVRNSSQGWMGGSCLPYHADCHKKQPWLSQHFHLWRSDSRGRTRAIPHIKTYISVSSDQQHTRYFLLTSANLSKAAWGCLQKDCSQLFIRSYELGVLLLPKFVTGGSEFSLAPSSTTPCLLLPYDLPLTPYPPGAAPWFMNTQKKETDVFGRTYS